MSSPARSPCLRSPFPKSLSTRPALDSRSPFPKTRLLLTNLARKVRSASLAANSMENAGVEAVAVHVAEVDVVPVEADPAIMKMTMSARLVADTKTKRRNTTARLAVDLEEGEAAPRETEEVEVKDVEIAARDVVTEESDEVNAVESEEVSVESDAGEDVETTKKTALPEEAIDVEEDAGHLNNSNLFLITPTE